MNCLTSFALIFVVACSNDVMVLDGGPADASATDASPVDDGGTDAPIDDGGTDTRPPDDASGTDAGTDAGPTDAGTDASPRDAGPAAEGGDYYAPLDPRDLPSHCSYPVTQAAPCVGNASGAAGSTVTIPIFGLQPDHCDGILQANVGFSPDSQLSITDVPESGNVCGRFESDRLWYCPWHFAPTECDQFVPEGRVWLLTISIAPGTPPGTYQLRPEGALQGGDISTGSGSSDPTCGSVSGALDGGVITVTP